MPFFKIDPRHPGRDFSQKGTGMTKKTFLFFAAFIFLAEIAVFSFFLFRDPDSVQDVIGMNEALHSVRADWNAMEAHENSTDLDYVVLDRDGALLFCTCAGLSESINQALLRGDGILDVEIDGVSVGKIIFHNRIPQNLQARYRRSALGLGALMLAQWVLCMILYFYLNRILVKPFRKLQDFAQHIARGNLDIPLEMDRSNLFGAFTESFDLMRSELRKAKKAEAKAAADKKELVAKLSHDIRTPLASIRAVSEVGIALADSCQPDLRKSGGDSPLQSTRQSYEQILRKADQINALVTELFTATLEELRRLPVVCTDLESRELKALLENADYLHRGSVPSIPDCLLYADKLRLQQVFDNLISNSYKYACTKIDICAYRSGPGLSVSIEDYGGGVDPEDLPLLKEKFKRGANASDTEGAGLGLYISDFFLQEMRGSLTLENGRHGLKATVTIPLSGALPP